MKKILITMDGSIVNTDQVRAIYVHIIDASHIEIAAALDEKTVFTLWICNDTEEAEHIMNELKAVLTDPDIDIIKMSDLMRSFS